MDNLRDRNSYDQQAFQKIISNNYSSSAVQRSEYRRVFIAENRPAEREDVARVVRRMKNFQDIANSHSQQVDALMSSEGRTFQIEIKSLTPKVRRQVVVEKHFSRTYRLTWLFLSIATSVWSFVAALSFAGLPWIAPATALLGLAGGLVLLLTLFVAGREDGTRVRRRSKLE